MKDSYTVVLLGASNATFSETTSDDALYGLIRRELERRVPGIRWETTAEQLFFGPSMAARAMAVVNRHRADVAVLVFSSTGFSMEAIVYSLQRIAPKLYQSAVKATTMLKAVAGGGPEGSDSARGLIFRAPRFLAGKVLRAVPLVQLEDAIAQTRATVENLLRREDVSVVCRLTVPTPYYRAQAAEDCRRSNVFNAAIRECCESRQVAWYDLSREMEAVGRHFIFGPDRLHATLETCQFEACIAADSILRELGLATES